MHSLKNVQVYLDRMSKPLSEKLIVAKFVPLDAQRILDVGTADGVVTSALADIFVDSQVHGIDLNEDFINLAKKKWKDKSNLSFEKIYLRDLLARKERYDAVVFCSVLHEFFTYGEGISSVLKALSDAHEVLNPGGRIIIRDMILFDYTKKADLHTKGIEEKVKAKEDNKYLQEFEKNFGPLTNLYTLNHYILKYWYKENWEREGEEHYVPVTFEQYESIFALLGMKEQYKKSYTIPFLKEKWMTDFGLTEEEVSSVSSTGVLVAEKL